LEFFEERSEPTGVLATFGREGGKPHLPIQTRLEGGDLGRQTIGRACFVGKQDGLPFESVRTAFEGEFGATGGHNGEESVAGVKMPWGEGSFPLSEKG
jgi:hypothetical protein